MSGTQARFNSIVRQLGICITIAAALSANVRSAYAVVVISDGFGDADRNNDGAITGYDTDLNDSGTFNDATADAALITRGITEVTAATDPSDVGIVWSGTRSFDTSQNLSKSKLRIFNDNVPIGSEDSSQIFNHGLALGVESRGGGSSFMGRFGQSIALGPAANDKVVVSLNFRSWAESNAPTTAPVINEIRWGVYQDTDHELGQTAAVGSGLVSAPPGATVMWGRDDGNWFANQPGAEGDKGIYVSNEFGSNLAAPTNARIKWEYNVAGINGTSPTGSNSNGRILEGGGVTDVAGTGGDTATIASPTTNGPGGIFNDTALAPHLLSMTITRLANGLANVAYSIDGNVVLSDDIKSTDTGYNVLQPIPFSYDYIAFRNTADYDYAIDDFKVEVFGSTAGVPGDYNNDGTVNAADYVAWRKDPAGHGGTPDGYNTWRANFGTGAGSGASLGGGAVPEPGSVWLLLAGAIAVKGLARRRSA